MYRLKITPRAKRNLRNIRQNYQTAIKLTLEEIKQDPSIGKPLSGDLTGRYSERIGVYRIIYQVNQVDQTVTIISVGHRSKVYN